MKKGMMQGSVIQFVSLVLLIGPVQFARPVCLAILARLIRVLRASRENLKFAILVHRAIIFVIPVHLVVILELARIMVNSTIA
jgi:hypothetical protein